MDGKAIGIAIAALVIGGIGGYAVGNSAGMDEKADKDMYRGSEESMMDDTEMMAEDGMGSEDMMDSGEDMMDSGDEMMDGSDEMAGMGDDSIVTVAVNTPSLSTLVAAVEAAELVETLDGPGPFTVFAPTNAAFDTLPAGTVDELLMPENQADLQGVLTYHVVPGIYRAADLTDGMTLTTVEGSMITIGVHDGAGVTVNDAPVSMADVEASNGVVHVIDQVILPPSMM